MSVEIGLFFVIAVHTPTAPPPPPPTHTHTHYTPSSAGHIGRGWLTGGSGGGWQEDILHMGVRPAVTSPHPPHRAHCDSWGREQVWDRVWVQGTTGLGKVHSKPIMLRALRNAPVQEAAFLAFQRTVRSGGRRCIPSCVSSELRIPAAFLCGTPAGRFLHWSAVDWQAGDFGCSNCRGLGTDLKSTFGVKFLESWS